MDTGSDEPFIGLQDVSLLTLKEQKSTGCGAYDPSGGTLMAEPDTLLVELYRSQELLELPLADWQMALQIFAAMGWSPERPLDAYVFPLGFVKAYEGDAMHHTGDALFAAIRAEPIISASVQMDL